MGLDCVEMVMAVEKEFGIEIPNEDAANATTVGELAKLTTEIASSTKESSIDYNEPLQFIIGYLVEEHGIPRQKINTLSKFVDDLGLD